MLYLVATPIGNLGDICQRALEVLSIADLVICEDTRKTGYLLKHFEILKPMLTFRVDNEKRALPRILRFLEDGKTIVLVTDSGTPGISDPGFLVVRAALEKNIEINAVPGPSAFVMALTLSGLPTTSFTFRGFPPHKSGPRKRYYEVDILSTHTLVYYESPYRLIASLQDALLVFGDRRGAVANDLTKKFENVKRARLSELIEFFRSNPPKGEYSVVIEGAGKSDFTQPA
jgi:16S rRNA (cytidine1402-2'-O)-methyltransferase